MSRFYPNPFGWLLVLSLGLWAVTIQAREFHYRYVSLDQVELPEGFILFDPIAINNSGRVYGNAYECATDTCDSIIPHIAVYADGAVTVLQPGIAYTANESGTVGGSVLIDPQNFIEQAAVFRGDQVELVPPQPGEFTSFVTALNDSGMALVTSYDDTFQPTFAYYKNGESTLLDFGPTVTSPFALRINNQKTVSGTTYASGNGRGFRFAPNTGETTQLDPLPTEPDAWALDVNNAGNVLGYSFIPGGIERIGVWDHDAEFKTYFVEGTPAFPTISNRLLFNDNNLIVITIVSSPVSERANSYLVPKPGVRLNLADQVENLPPEQHPNYIIDINNNGDMIGWSVQDFNIQGVFLLERIGATGPKSFATTRSSSGVKNKRRSIPTAAAATLQAMLRRHLSALKSGSALPQDFRKSLLSK